jgi:hypothetical protein
MTSFRVDVDIMHTYHDLFMTSFRVDVDIMHSYHDLLSHAFIMLLDTAAFVRVQSHGFSG